MNRPVAPSEQKDLRSILDAYAGSPSVRWRRGLMRWGGAAAALLLLLLALRTMSGSENRTTYLTEPITRGDLVVIVTATGSLQPTNLVEVSSELSGTVREVLVDYNATVTVGQPLARLDSDKLEATVASSRARLLAARARVAESEATLIEKEQELSRKRSLVSKGINPAQDLDVANAAYERAAAGLASARAEVAVAESELKLNETNLSKACICSPISGVVLRRNVEPGQTVASALQAPVLFVIAEDLRQMELQVDVDEADVGQVAVGQKALFKVDAFPERSFPATIRDVRYASETIQGVVTYKAILAADNAELLLRPGMTATAEIRVSEIANALLVPNAALRYAPPAEDESDNRSLLKRLLPGPPRFRRASAPEETGPNRTVWLLVDGQAQASSIVIGRSDGTRTEVVSGAIEPGQMVIVDQVTSGS